MPQTPRPYIHCIRCHMPLELPSIKRCETETWYIDFAICSDCKTEMLAMHNPSIEFTLSGDCLKTLLKAKRDQILMATIFPTEGISEAT